MPSTGNTQAWTDRFTGRFAYWAILAWGALNIVALATSQLPLLFLHDSVGNGDGYILLTVDDFRHTGLLYPPIGPAHLTPTLYSPLLYLMHAAAWAVIPAENPYVGPRLVEFAWYLLCLLASAMLAKELVPARRAFSLGLLLAASFSVMTYWVLQLRSDFPGIACSLFALWFLMSRRPSGSIWAGLCAGLALQFKITFIAAAAAGFLWLLLYRRWGDLIRFSVSAGVFTAASYGYFAWREPQMFTNILMFSKMIPHPAGVVAFFRQVLAEPALLLALAALLPILHPVFARPLPRWQLLLMFLGISFAIATFSSLQAGASINYFYEILLASTPLAVLGLLRLYGGRLGSAGILLGLLMVVMFVLPAAARTFRGMRQAPGQVTQRNRDYENLRQALAGVKVLSSLGDVTILVPERVITEPVLLNYLVLTKGADVSQLAGRIRDNGFDTVVTQPADYSWRGVPVLERGLYQAIVDSYRPYCLFGGKMLFHLPRRKDSGLEDRLKNIGCEVVTCGPGMKCPGLGVQVEAFQP